MTNLNELIQPQICEISPYQPGMDVEALARTHGIDSKDIIKLASNENPDGMSPRVEQTVRTSLKNASLYPDGYKLTQALAKYYELQPANIILGNGSNDVLDLVARVFLGRGTEAISSEYAFSIYPLITKITGADSVVVPAKDFGHDLDRMADAVSDKSKVIWIANPNNPTGTFVSYEKVRTFLEKIPPQVFVVLDEAYYEYLSPAERVESQKWLEDFPNLIITRTFSKIYGLAGLRVGYGLASPAICELLNRVRQPFNVAGLSLAAAEAALADQDFANQSFENNKKGLAQLTSGMEEMGLDYIKPFGNFVTVRVGKAGKIYEELLKTGIIVRPLGGQGMGEYLRVSVGKPEQNTRFLKTLKDICKTGVS